MDGATDVPDAAPPPGHQDAATDAATRPDAAPDADAAVPPYGLDERPANPTCKAPSKPGMPGIGVKRAFAGLKFDHPVGLFQEKTDDDHFYVIEQSTGRLRRFPNQADATSTDVETMLTLKVVPPDYEGDEVGLLGLAFDPEFASNGRAYVFYNPSTGALRSVVERYTLSADKKRFDPASKLTILAVPQPYHNHKGGHIAFGPDGHLYIGLGDGGGGDDQHCFALDPQVALGKFLRIDVRGSSTAKPYAVPADNPYASGGGLPEIYAIGVRNPWRWSFDCGTGDLWAGDVGQNEYEEVDRIERGKSYGWKAKEGKSCFAERSCSASDLYPERDIPELPKCDDPSFTDPVWAYGRSEGAVITGGYVYRGTAHPTLVGKYVYGDFTNGRIWALTTGDQLDNRLLVNSNLALASFGEDNHGELYAVDWQAGTLHALVAAAHQAEGGPAKLLSKTGCVDPAQPKKPVKAMIPYDVRVPFWSDGAEKQRWFALPDDSELAVAQDGDLELPPGAVAMKYFELEGKPVETRFFVRFDDGSYGGYTYRWHEDGKDASLLDKGLDTQVGEKAWHFPSPAECDSCHHSAAGNHLGLELIQLDKDFTYPTGRLANQLRTLEHIGMLTIPPEVAPKPLALLGDESASLEDRVRAYLHANCSQCHRPGGPGRGAMDMRHGAADPHLCYQAPLEGDLGIGGALIVSPGEVKRSLLHVRMARRDEKGMPPLASLAVDESGAQLVRRWIQSANACE